MSEFERSEIIYEEGWRSRKPPVAPEPESEEAPAPAAGDASPKPLLISIQLIVCAAAALVIFLLRAMDSPAYHGFMTEYKNEMNRPLISREFFGGADESLPASADEVRVEASPDEAAPR